MSWSTDGTYVDWSSDFGIDAVIMKGGDAANLYAYDPEAFGGTGLVSPENDGGNIPNLSHIEFCYDYEVEVSKDVETSFTRTYNWEIEKSVEPASADRFFGQSADFDNTVELTRSYVDSDFKVWGTISIYNPDPENTAYVASVVDNPGGGLATVVCPAWEIAPLSILECTYEAGPRETNTFAAVNTATVYTTADSLVGDGAGTADIDFGDEPTTVVGYESVNVSDSIEGPLANSAIQVALAIQTPIAAPLTSMITPMVSIAMTSITRLRSMRLARMIAKPLPLTAMPRLYPKMRQLLMTAPTIRRSKNLQTRPLFCLTPASTSRLITRLKYLWQRNITKRTLPLQVRSQSRIRIFLHI